MKLSIDFGRWTATKAVVAVAGALAIAGAIGSAVAMSPIVSPPIKWAGGVEFDPITYIGGVSQLYTVPAGRNFLLTDLIVSNEATTENRVSILSAVSDCQNANRNRLGRILVPAKQTLHLPLVTGIGFSAGQRVCLSVGASEVGINGRGFLFTAAPAS